MTEKNAKKIEKYGRGSQNAKNDIIKTWFCYQKY